MSSAAVPPSVDPTVDGTADLLVDQRTPAAEGASVPQDTAVHAGEGRVLLRIATSVPPTSGPTTRADARRGGAGRRPASLAPATRASVIRRRLGALAVLLLVAFVLTAAIGRIGAVAELEERVAGHVVIEPGETLWDVAEATRPDGVDTRAQLTALRELNGLEDSQVDAWQVVLVPAR
ncbi:MAG: hypothetical protein JJT89_02535 [Nitriliruptoraceae bacterium]|nr:hypothetical protein [Nitriliruptoraceae bacterium]